MESEEDVFVETQQANALFETTGSFVQFARQRGKASKCCNNPGSSAMHVGPNQGTGLRIPLARR